MTLTGRRLIDAAKACKVARDNYAEALTARDLGRAREDIFQRAITASTAAAVAGAEKRFTLREDEPTYTDTLGHLMVANCALKEANDEFIAALQALQGTRGGSLVELEARRQAHYGWLRGQSGGGAELWGLDREEAIRARDWAFRVYSRAQLNALQSRDN